MLRAAVKVRTIVDEAVEYHQCLARLDRCSFLTVAFIQSISFSIKIHVLVVPSWIIRVPSHTAWIIISTIKVPHIFFRYCCSCRFTLLRINIYIMSTCLHLIVPTPRIVPVVIVITCSIVFIQNTLELVSFKLVII